MGKYDVEEILKSTLLSYDEITRLGKEVKSGDIIARNKLKDALVCLGVHMVQQYSDKYSLDFKLLFEYIGMSWFEQLYTYFFSYEQCFRDINKCIEEAEKNTYMQIGTIDKEIRIPLIHYERVRDCREILLAKLGREPLLEEIAKQSSVANDNVAIIVNAIVQAEKKYEEDMQRKEDLRVLISKYEGATFDKQLLFETIQTMTEKEKALIIYRLGLDDGKPKTRKEAAGVFDISEDRVRMIESKMLRRYMSGRPKRSKKLMDFLA